jgi:hypothetical protein
MRLVHPKSLYSSGKMFQSGSLPGSLFVVCDISLKIDLIASPGDEGMRLLLIIYIYISLLQLMVTFIIDVLFHSVNL